MKNHIPFIRVLLIGAGAMGAGFLFVSCLGCRGGTADSVAVDRLVVAAWNAQALFDGEDAGTEYKEYRKAAGWTDARYRERLAAVGVAVAAMADGGPDILALEEVENAGVLCDLAMGPLKAMGYGYQAAAAIEGSALTMGLLSRYPLGKPRVHAVNLNGAVPPRPILEVEVQIPDAPVTLFLCHWKSKLGGSDGTEPLRRASASVLSRRIAELSASDPARDFLVLGDLNENYDEFERRGGGELTALLPDTEAAARVAVAAGNDSSGGGDAGDPLCIVLSSERPPASSAFPKALALYSPWPEGTAPGSYAWQGAWETIDHALAGASLFDGARWDWSAFCVVAMAPFVDGEGLPVGYNPRIGKGLSDHLPIVVELRKAHGGE